MGNRNSTNMYKPNVLPSSNESLIFDKIAAKFILSQSSSDINKLTNLEYCNNLIILTSKIIRNESGGANNEKDDIEKDLPSINNEKEKGVATKDEKDKNEPVVNDKKDENVPAVKDEKEPAIKDEKKPGVNDEKDENVTSIKEKDENVPAVNDKKDENVTAIKDKKNENVTIKENVPDVTIDENNINQTKENKEITTKEKCDILPEDRAKLYVKVAHLVAAIMTAINPVIYTNEGLVSLFDRQNMKSEANIEPEILDIGHYSFCSRRYDSLFKIGESTTKEVINDNICSINDNSRKGLREFSKYDGSEKTNPLLEYDTTKPNLLVNAKTAENTLFGKPKGEGKDIKGEGKDIKGEGEDDGKGKDKDGKDKDGKDKDGKDDGKDGKNKDGKDGKGKDDGKDDGKDGKDGKGKDGKGKGKDEGENEGEDDDDEDTKSGGTFIGSKFEDDNFLNKAGKLGRDITVSDGSSNKMIYKKNMDELGIPELKSLYYDDGFDTKSNTFRNMSENSKTQYKKDIEQFYKQFTGDDMPVTIKSFSDIKLKDYNKQKMCLDNENSQTNINIEPSIFTEFASNYKEMASSIFNSHLQLWNIFTQLIDVDESTFEKAILTRKDVAIKTSKLFSSSGKSDEDKFNKINKLTNNTREIIVKMYIKCEQHFLKGVQILESVLATIIAKTTPDRLETLNRNISELLSHTTV